MSKTVVLVAGILVAAGAVAAVSQPGLLDDLAEGLDVAKHRITQSMGVSDENAATSREERRSRRAKQRRETDGDDAQAAGGEGGKAERRSRREMWRKDTTEEHRSGSGRGDKERLARQEDEDGEAASEEGRGQRVAAYDRGDAGREGGRRASFSAGERGAANFARMDKNGDGAVDASEFVIAETERIAARARQFFQRFDADGDGKVTREEFQRAARERVTALDVDEDAQVAAGRAVRK